MPRHVLIIQGHPDHAGGHLCHALGSAYADGAVEAGHEVRTIDAAQLELPYIRNQHQWLQPATSAAMLEAQADVAWADHLVVIYPLWLGDMPAVLKSFLEHLSRGGFVIEFDEKGAWKKNLAGKSARVVVTMGMPAFAYRWYFFSHSLKSLERNVLKLAGVRPVRETLLGMVEGEQRARVRARWLARMRALGARAG
jgi:putative NADPH-quinone reductase